MRPMVHCFASSVAYVGGARLRGGARVAARVAFGELNINPAESVVYGYLPASGSAAWKSCQNGDYRCGNDRRSRTMPKLKNKVPSYRLHQATGQAVVTLNGRDIYLGACNSAERRSSMTSWPSGIAATSSENDD